MQRLLLSLARFAVGIYYRRTRLGGAVPARGPVLLVANHPNGLVDPVLLAGTTDRPPRFLGKAPLFELPVLGRVLRGLEALPVHRSQDAADTSLNEATFAAVDQALARGELVCLFPEGKSHDAPVLQRLKTGAARMALGAEARRRFELGVRIVPVGLVYRAKRRFRSRVATWIGAPLEVRELAQLHGQDERAAVLALTERIAQGLAAVTLELDRWEDLPLLELAEKLLAVPGEDQVVRQQRLARGLRALRARGEPRLAPLSARIAAFRERLEDLRLEPGELERRTRSEGTLACVGRRLAAALLLLPFALAGSLFWALPYFLVPRVPRWLGSPRDLHATVQILAGLVFFPLWGLALALAAAVLAGPWLGLALLVLALPLLLAALWLRDRGLETARDALAFLRSPPGGARRGDLVAEREALARELGALAAELRGTPPEGLSP